MKKLQSNLILISFLLFLLFLAVGIFTSAFIVRDRLDHIVYANKFLEIDEEYESVIYSKNNNLSTITIHMKNPALENTGKVSFLLYDNDKLIREVEFTGRNIGDPGDVKLKFVPIADSAGKRYDAIIAASVDDPKLSVFVDDQNTIGGWFYNRNAIGMSGLIKATTSFIGRASSDKLFLILWGVSITSVTFLYLKSKDQI